APAVQSGGIRGGRSLFDLADREHPAVTSRLADAATLSPATAIALVRNSIGPAAWLGPPFAYPLSLAHYLLTGMMAVSRTGGGNPPADRQVCLGRFTHANHLNPVAERPARPLHPCLRAGGQHGLADRHRG